MFLQHGQALLCSEEGTTAGTATISGIGSTATMEVGMRFEILDEKAQGVLTFTNGDMTVTGTNTGIIAGARLDIYNSFDELIQTVIVDEITDGSNLEVFSEFEGVTGSYRTVYTAQIASGITSSEILTIPDTDEITIDDTVTLANDTYDIRYGHSWDSFDGLTRWEDMLSYDSNSNVSILLGDKDGYIYEFSEGHETDNNNVDIDCTVTTAGLQLNDKKHNFRLLEATVRMQDSDGDSINVSASTDFDEDWTPDINLTSDGDNDYIEGRANFEKRGRQMQLRLTNEEGGEIKIESISIGFNHRGITK